MNIFFRKQASADSGEQSVVRKKVKPVSRDCC